MNKGHAYPQIQSDVFFPDPRRYERCARQMRIYLNIYSHEPHLPRSLYGYSRVVTKPPNTLQLKYEFPDLVDSGMAFSFELIYDGSNDLSQRGIKLAAYTANGGYDIETANYVRDTYQPVPPNMPPFTFITYWPGPYAFRVGIRNPPDYNEFPIKPDWYIQNP